MREPFFLMFFMLGAAHCAAPLPPALAAAVADPSRLPIDTSIRGRTDQFTLKFKKTQTLKSPSSEQL